MKYLRQHHSAPKFVTLLALCLAAVVSLANLSRASIGNVSKADLVGNWQVSLLSSGGGCGPGTTQVNFTLNASGAATNATEVSHSSGCGNSISTGNTFTINTMNASGAGTAGLSCGPGCGFTFAIQVAPDRGSFNLVDITDPGQFIAGTAIHQ